jgi:hypothetical protein
MSRQIKLIWDFVALLLQNGRAPRNPSKRIHSDRKLPLNRTGFVKGEMQAIAFMVVTDEYMVRGCPKPHRGELYVEEQ